MFLWMWFINLFISLVKLNIVLVCMYLMVFLLIIECGWVSLMWCNVVEWVVVVLEDICILGVMVLLRNLFLVDIILIQIEDLKLMMMVVFWNWLQVVKQFMMWFVFIFFGLLMSKGILVCILGLISMCGIDGQYWLSIICILCSMDGIVDKVVVLVSCLEFLLISLLIVSVSLLVVILDLVCICYCCMIFVCFFILDSRFIMVWVLWMLIVSSMVILY